MRRYLLLSALLALPALAADQATRDQVAKLMNQRQWGDAKSVLEKVTAADPQDAEAWKFLGQVHLALQDADAAVAALEKAATLMPADATYQLVLGNAYGFAAQKAGLF